MDAKEFTHLQNHCHYVAESRNVVRMGAWPALEAVEANLDELLRRYDTIAKSGDFALFQSDAFKEARDLAKRLRASKAGAK